MPEIIRHRSEDIIVALEKLKPGESFVYAANVTGWIEFCEFGKLMIWLTKAHEDGNYDFTQRKIGVASPYSDVGVFEYRATRREIPQPVRWVSE